MNQDKLQGDPVDGPLAPPPPRRRRWLTALMLAVTFGCGMIVGGVAALKFIDRRVQEAIHHPERMPQRVAGRLKGRLGLSDKQHTEVLRVLTSRQKELFAIRRRVQPEVEGVLDQIEADVAKLLEPAQKQKWGQDVRTFRERFTPPLPAEETMN